MNPFVIVAFFVRVDHLHIVEWDRYVSKLQAATRIEATWDVVDSAEGEQSRKGDYHLWFVKPDKLRIEWTPFGKTSLGTSSIWNGSSGVQINNKTRVKSNLKSIEEADWLDDIGIVSPMNIAPNPMRSNSISRLTRSTEFSSSAFHPSVQQIGWHCDYQAVDTEPSYTWWFDAQSGLLKEFTTNDEWHGGRFFRTSRISINISPSFSSTTFNLPK